MHPGRHLPEELDQRIDFELAHLIGIGSRIRLPEMVLTSIDDGSPQLRQGSVPREWVDGREGIPKHL